MSRGSGPRLAWSHGLPIMSALGLMGPGGWRERNLGGCHAVRVHGLPWSDHGLAGVARPGSVIFMVSDHERQGLGGCRAWVRGLPWSPIMSAVGLGGCRAVRVRGFPWTPIMSNKLERVSRAGFGVSRLLRS